MSSQRGNVIRHRPQKYKNQSSFKNTLHCNEKTKFINNLRAEGCCTRCKDIIEWKIKYKKYKPLTQPKKCIKCDQKTVKRAYFIVCQLCAEKHKICVKCGKDEEIVLQTGLSKDELVKNQAQLEQELKYLPERKKRTFLRLHAQGKLTGDNSQDGAGVSGSYSDKDCDDSDNGSDDVPSDNEGSDNNDTEDLEDKVTHLDLHQHKQDTLQRSISDEVYSNSRVNNYSDVSNDIDV